MTAATNDLPEVDKQARLDQLRRRIAAVPGRTRDTTTELFADEPKMEKAPKRADVGVSTERVDRATSTDPRPMPASSLLVLQAPVAIAALLPRAGIARGTVTAVNGAQSLLIALVAATTGSGEHAAIIGLPRFGILAAHEMGADLTRCAFIGSPGDGPAEVAAVLLDGISLIVLGLGGRSIAPTRARAVTARARTKNAALIVVDGSWPGADLTLDARVSGCTGLGHGRGRIRGVQLDVVVTGRGTAPRTGHVELNGASGKTTWSTRVEQAQRFSKAL